MATLMAVLCACAHSAGAQVRYSVAEVREIVDAALEALLPPDKELSRISVAQRNIFFDHAQTLADFGHDELVEAAPARLQLRRRVENASSNVLEDCRGFGPLRCVGLGQGVYVTVEPARQSESEAVVWVHVWWTSRQSDAPDERVIRMGFSSEVFLTRATGERWRYVRTGMVNVS